MGGGDTQETQTTQNSSTSPWAQAMPLINRLFGSYGNASTDVTGAQSDALGGVRQSLYGMPDFSGMLTGAIGKLTSQGGPNFQPQIDQWNDAYKGLQSNLGDVASGKYLDPYSTPGMTGWLDTLTNDITKDVKGVYAGSGRDPSGAGSFSERLGRGLSEGLSPVVAAQANRNRADQMAAANSLYGAGGTTAQGTAALTKSPFDYQLSLSNALPGLVGGAAGLYGAPQKGMLDVANTEYGMPYQNMSALLNPALQLGGLGSTSSGTGTSTRTQEQSLFSNILGGVLGASALGRSGGIGGMLGGLGSGLGSLGTGMSSLMSFLPMLSDERAKENIEPAGMLDDGQTVYAYNYLGDPTPQIGLLAQEVEQHVPDAVRELPSGLKVVDYARATRPARELRGMLDMLEAA